MPGNTAWSPRGLAAASLAAYAVLLAAVAISGAYALTYVLFFVAFLFLYMSFPSMPFLAWWNKLSTLRKAVVIFLFALLLRFLMLFQDQILTHDIVFYVERSQGLLDGKIPYQDFDVNKPPMYAYMLHILGKALGPGFLQFRAFFSIIDALVAVLVFQMCRMVYDERWSFYAALIYALCPLPIVSVGLSGHYEPIVMAVVLLSVITLLWGKYNASALLLGAGFALKFFPAIILPFMLARVRTWRARVLYVILFAVPFALSLVPIMLVSWDGFLDYMTMQGFGWRTLKSLAFGIEQITGVTEVAGVGVSLMVTMAMFALVLWMFISHVRRNFNAGAWFKSILVLYAVHAGLVVTGYLRFSSGWLGIADPVPWMIGFSAVYFPLTAILFARFFPRLKIEVEEREEFFVLLAFAMIFMVFSSGQYNPWYLLWILPLLLAIRNWKIRLLLLWIIPWNMEGTELTVVPWG